MKEQLSQYSPVMTVMLKAVRIATRKLVRDFGEVENLQNARRGPVDFVTAARKKAGEQLVRELQKVRPGYSISLPSGEIKGEDANSEYRWIIEPLDGGLNFSHGFPIFCTTVALEKKQPNGKTEVVAAVVESPILKETFWAEKNVGAWLETADRAGMQRLRVTDRRRLASSMLCIGSYKQDLKNTGTVASSAGAVRCIGSTALGLVYTAAGRYDCFIQSDANVWDMAAGVLIVKEAGGSVADLKDKDKMLESGSVVAANEDLHRVVFKSL